MRVWQRTRVVESCGSCGKAQDVWQPIQVVTLPNTTAQSKRRIRCVSCADGPIDLEQLEAFDVAEEGRQQVPTSSPGPRGICSTRKRAPRETSDMQCPCGCGAVSAAGRRFATVRCFPRFIRRTQPDYYAQLAKRRHAAGRTPPKHLRQSELLLMAAGRYREAADLIYERGYGAGWSAGRRGFRQAKRHGAAA